MFIPKTNMERGLKRQSLLTPIVPFGLSRAVVTARLFQNHFRILSFISLFALLVPVAIADTVVADRPGFSTGTHTVKPGRLNLEIGYQAAFSNEGVDKTTHTTPLLTLRTGVSEQTEINLLWSGWNHINNGASDTSVSDLSIGGKYRLRQTDRYNLTALALLSLPVGSGASTSDHVDPTIGLLGDYSLTDRLDLFGVIQTVSSVESGGRDYNFQSAIGLAFSHTDNFGTFVEYYNDVPLQSGDAETAHVINGGAMWLVTTEIQLDINGGVSLDNNTDDFIGFGLAMRF